MKRVKCPARNRRSSGNNDRDSVSHSVFRDDNTSSDSKVLRRYYVFRDDNTICGRYNIAFILFMECNLYPNMKGNFKLRLWPCQERSWVTRTDSWNVPGLPFRTPIAAATREPSHIIFLLDISHEPAPMHRTSP